MRTAECVLCRVGFKGPHGHVRSIEEFGRILDQLKREWRERHERNA